MINTEILTEKWKPFLDGYGITNKGRVFTFKNQRPYREMKLQKSGAGLYYVIVHHMGKRRKLFIHLLVVANFGDRHGRLLGAESENLRRVGLTIKHVDNDPTNNRVENLEIAKFKRRTKKEMEGIKVT